MKEKWKDIEFYEGLYKVSNLGRIKSLDRRVIDSRGRPRKLKGKTLNPMLGTTGYLRVALSKDGKLKPNDVHRLVAKAFKKNSKNKSQVNHKNGVKTDNRACNLEWSTPLENITHATKTGLINQVGSRNPTAILTESQVIEIDRLLTENNLTQEVIGKLYGVSKYVVNAINKGRSWTHVTGRNKKVEYEQ